MTLMSIPQKYGHGNCILCGDSNPQSLKLAFTLLDDGSVQTVLHGHPRLQGYDTLLHGGVIASLLDSAMTHCLFHQGVEAVTADLHVRYAHPVPCDAELTITARTVSVRGPIYKMRSELLIDGEIKVWAEAKFVRRTAVNS